MLFWWMVKESLEEWELANARVSGLLSPLQPLQRHQQQERAASTIPELRELLGPGSGHIWEVTGASEKWGRGEGKDKHSFSSHFSLAAENWQSQLFLFSLPPPWFCLMLLNRLEPVLCSLAPEDMSHCPRVKSETAALLEWEFSLLVGIVWRNAGQNKLERLALLIVK